MRRGIELNGIANIMILVDQITQEPESNDHINVALKIKEQAKTLERYMIAYCEAVNSGTQPPQWHEVRENPNQYPTNRERIAG